jgi:hypothetical protein
VIFRAPIGHMLISKPELEAMQQHLEDGNAAAALDYLRHCIEEVDFYDNVRKQSEIKKMHQEDGDLVKAKEIEKELRESILIRTNLKKALKSAFLPL